VSVAVSALIGLPVAKFFARSHAKLSLILWLSLLTSHIASAAAVAFFAWVILHKSLLGTLVPYAIFVGCIVATVVTRLARLTTYMDSSRK
jgi:hypothetical protein